VVVSRVTLADHGPERENEPNWYEFLIVTGCAVVVVLAAATADGATVVDRTVVVGRTGLVRSALELHAALSAAIATISARRIRVPS